MAFRGTFRECLDRMVEVVGSNKKIRAAILYNSAKKKYSLTNWDTARVEMLSDIDRDIRIVMAVTFGELRQIMDSQQFNLFRREENGGIS